MRTDYNERLKLSTIPDNEIKLYSVNKELLCFNYNSIVIGERGPYIECLFTQIEWFNFNIPLKLLWKTDSDMVDYIEYRSNVDNVKLYKQKRTVNYAAYKINHAYISPFDCYFYKSNGDELIRVIDPLNKKSTS